jgi:L-lactate dehydrogenase (cytochrome)
MSNDEKTAEPAPETAPETAKEIPLLKEPPSDLALRYPTIMDLRKRARRRVPRFAFDYVDGAAGAGETGLARNAAALDAIELVPRYGLENFKADMEVELFGRTFAAPVGIAPMGLPGMVWPGGEEAFARAAQAARIPFTLGSSAGAPIERIAELAPDCTWFQLYRMPRNDLAINFDLVRRAEAAGVHVLVLTLDVPARTKRPRELRNKLIIPYRPGLHTVLDVLPHPGWLMALSKHGQNSFANYQAYAGENLPNREVVKFARQNSGGTFTWDEVAQFRGRWPGPLVVKGILHPQDAEKAVELGVDGIVVSNHGGRQLESAPASIDVLPAVVAAVGDRATVLFDSGIRSGEDVVRALALGAKSTLSGRAFMYGLAALGDRGPGHVAKFFFDEIAEALRQVGAHNTSEPRNLVIRHPGAFEL